MTTKIESDFFEKYKRDFEGYMLNDSLTELEQKFCEYMEPGFIARVVAGG
jgi:hypothetical protein